MQITVFAAKFCSDSKRFWAILAISKDSEKIPTEQSKRAPQEATSSHSAILNFSRITLSRVWFTNTINSVELSCDKLKDNPPIRKSAISLKFQTLFQTLFSI